MPTLVEQLRSAKRRLICFPVREWGTAVIYQVRTVRQEELRKLGHIQLMGAQAVRHLEVETAALAEREQRLRAVKTKKARAKVEAELQAEAEQRARDYWASFAQDPDNQEALVLSCEAYAMQAVEAVGRAREGVPAGPLPVGTAAPDVCEPLDDGATPRYLMPMRLVDDRPTTDLQPHEMPIGELTEGERIMLGAWIMQALSMTAEVAKELRPFETPPRSST